MNSDDARARRRWTIAAVAIAAAVVAGGIAWVILSGVWAEPDAADQGAGPATSAPPTTGTDGSATDPSAESPGAEGPPSDGDTPPTATGLPLPDDTAPLVRLPLPADAHAEGALVSGFPSDVIGLPPQSTVSRSSLASEGARLQAGLEGRSPLGADQVVAFYTTEFSGHGMAGREASAAPGSRSMAFTLGANTITVTATDLADGSSFSVLGVFTAE